MSSGQLTGSCGAGLLLFFGASVMVMNARMEELLAEGFEPLTYWLLRGDKIKPESIGWDNVSGWIYAFVVEEQVKYIGLTAGVLRTRLDNYSYITDSYSGGKGQTDRLRGLILDVIKPGGEVTIYGLRHPGDDGIRTKRESELIRHFNPPWNNYIPAP